MKISEKRENNLSHLAIIMDGNGRWSEQKGLPREDGHKEGVKSLRKLLRYIDDFNITIDTTIIKKSRDIVSNIPINHIKIDKKINYYKLRDKSPLTFIVEFVDNEVSDFYFILEGYHAKYSNADLNNSSIKEDFVEFLDIIYN